MECLEQKEGHFVRDCEHDFTGKFIHWPSGGSVTCKKCEMTAMDHDCMVGPWENEDWLISRIKELEAALQIIITNAYEPTCVVMMARKALKGESSGRS